MFRSAKTCCWIVLACSVMGCTGSKADSDSGDCVVARHVDQCCSAPVPASTAEMSKDACLQRVARAPKVDVCSAVSQCNKVACSLPPTPSRVAARNGGQCAFANECESDADCVLATNEAFCCGCPEWVPRSLLSTDPCWSTAGNPVATACDACPAAAETACAACSGVAGTGRCVDGGNGYKRCVGQ